MSTIASSRLSAKALGVLLTLAAIGVAMLPAAAAAQPRRKVVPLGPSSPPPPRTPAIPPMPEPARTPYPPPGYGRWYLPPAPPDDYLYDLPPETEGRHSGFFMRLALGPGFYTMQAASAEGALELRAPGAGLNLILGGALWENFVIYGEMALHSTLDPEVDGYRGNRARPGTSVTTAALGAGVGYYLMPAQVFFTGSLLVAQTRAVDRPTERLLGKTELGPAMALSIGRDWWMSPSWTFGVVGRLQLGRFKDPAHGRAGAMWDALGGSIAFCVGFE